MQLLLRDKAATLDFSFFQKLFLQHLHPKVCMTASTRDAIALKETAQLADKVMEVATCIVVTVECFPNHR